MNENEIQEKLHELDTLQSACTRCGICLEACSTYQTTGWEHESPRGRIQLAEHLMEGKIHPESLVLDSFDRCLGCQACEKVCPQGVQYNLIRSIVQEVKIALKPALSLKKEQTKWVYKMTRRLWRAFGWKWLIPSYIKGLSIAKSYLYQKKTPRLTDSITLIVSCIEDISHHAVIDQTVNLLKKLNVNVDVDRHQPCCGALFERVNLSKSTLSCQKKCLQKFKQWMPTKAVFLSPHCQNFTLRQHQFEHEIIDLYELIYMQLNVLQVKFKLRSPLRAYYQPYCAKRGEDYALKVLQTIEGLSLKTIWPANSCCGGYAGETFLNPEPASLLGQAKWAEMPPASTLIITSPDCYVQFAQRLDLKILYPVQLLDQIDWVS